MASTNKIRMQTFGTACTLMSFLGMERLHLEYESNSIQLLLKSNGPDGHRLAANVSVVLSIKQSNQTCAWLVF